MFHRPGTLVALSLLASLAAGCAPLTGSMVRLPGPALPCRVPVTAPPSAGTPQISWIAPSRPDQRAKLDAWCGTAGPPVIAAEAAPVDAAAERVIRPVSLRPTPARQSDELAVVSWNVHAGTGDVAELVRRLRTGELVGHPVTRFVLLLQEAMREGPVVPRVVQPGAEPPRPAGLGARQTDVVQLAERLGLSLYYVPSMRNGTPGRTDQDRGNAILSTEALHDYSAIELPFERQRRVAIQASVSGESAGGQPWSVRMVSAHLESTVPASRLWIMANGARVRQAGGLITALPPAGPLVLAGDMNTWLGFADPAYKAIASAIPGIVDASWQPTFRPFFRLDHMFARLPDSWAVETRRLDDRLGSDHYPLLALMRQQPVPTVTRTN